ncbi:endonuclease/exonuclease/phosphatase family protein [bacterium]|nr:endonuclease/exonuclease/phosphatase family protein [bacterium]QQR57284.1 MAG: endonuclease/exonuclease/phosphatase family protein [Candidatus Melainabacteria bacterium]
MFLKLPRFTTVFFFPIVVGTGLFYALSFVEGNYFCDLISQARLLLLVPLGLILLITLLRNNAAISFCATVLFCIIGIQTVFGSGHLLDKRVESLPKVESKNQISILNFNTEFQHNDNINSFIAYCKEKDPDIVVLTDSGKKWTDAVEKLEYPSCMHILKGVGISVLSKYRTLGSQVYSQGISKHPQVHFQIIKDNQIINIVVLHLSAMQTPAGYNDRQSELQTLQNQLKKTNYPTIVLGDTNSSNWSSTIKLFLNNTNLKDTQDGFITIPTWPARKGKIIKDIAIPAFVAIDNIFVSKDFEVLERKVGPALGSDHMPVFAKLELDSKL